MFVGCGVYGLEVAELEVKVWVSKVFHVEPPSVEYLKVIVPVGVIPVTPVIVTVAVTDCPTVIGLVGVSVGDDIVGFALLTVKVTSVLVGEA